jgi:GH25 family lysozyme M1 (1,4-beta-N-acetylmuramidase)
MATLNVVVDLSHHNKSPNFERAKADGVVGVIYKATQDQSGVDPTYKNSRKRAKDAGLLWGAYHFGTGSDGLKQAENFLNTVGDPSDTLLALDFEPNPTGPTMTLEEARSSLAFAR